MAEEAARAQEASERAAQAGVCADNSCYGLVDPLARAIGRLYAATWPLTQQLHLALSLTL